MWNGIVFTYERKERLNVRQEGDTMIISERIFKILKDKNMTQMEFAKRAGFSNSAISDLRP